MIIDDETALRSLLKQTIDWEEKGLMVVGEAASGSEAINIIDDLKPDIIFVDIRMPFMDGIEFSKLAIKRYPRLKILILTAFDDFSYAKECIGIGITEYLLKPIVKADIDGILDQVIQQLDAEKRNDKKTETDTTEFPDSIKMSDVEDYIKKNYKNSDLNLTAVAQKFGFNASYLSRKFKEEIDCGFMEYLIDMRMKRAGVLAKREELMYRSAEQVGIPDPNYFGKCFRKYYGISYSEYVKKCVWGGVKKKHFDSFQSIRMYCCIM